MMTTTPGTISFDIDGVLANFIRSFTRIGNSLFGTPIAGHGVQKNWMFEDVPFLQLDKPKTKEIWGKIKESPSFWRDLDPLNISVMQSINAIDNKIFITNRLGMNPLGQTIDFLTKWGVYQSKVFVAENKVPVAQEQNLVAHIDDYYPNCIALKQAIPNAYVALLWTDYNECHHNEWVDNGGEIVLSVEQFIETADKRGLVKWQPWRI